MTKQRSLWGAIALVSVAATPAFAAKDDVFAKCSVRLAGQNVIPPEKFKALADNIADPEFAKFDDKCLGKAANPAALAKSVALSQQAKQDRAGRIVVDLKDIADAQAPGAPRAVPSEDIKRRYVKPTAVSLPVLFRDAYSTYSLLSPIAPRERANGTQFSYTEDYEKRNGVLSGKGALIGWNVLSLSADSDNPLKDLGVTRMLWVPGFEFDQTRNRSNKKGDTDYLAFKVMGETEVEQAPESLFPLQYFRYGGYWKTDSRGESGIGGAFTEWQPYKLEWGIGVAPRVFGTPMQFRWQPIVRVESEKVVDAGLLTNLQTGDFYTRGGPILRADIFFADGYLRNFVFGVQYRHLWSFDRGNADKDIRYFQADATYNLDDAGVFALSATYRDGILPGNGTRVRDVRGGLTIKN